MKILYLTDFEIPAKSASSVHVMKMCEAFSIAGHDVTLICAKGEIGENSVFEYYGVKAIFKIEQIPLARIKGRLFWFALKARVIVKKNDPDIVYSRSVLSFLFVAGKTRMGILEAHKPVWEYGLVYRLAFSIIMQLRNFNRLVVISEALKRIFLKKYPNLSITVAHDAASLVTCMRNDININIPGITFHVGYIGNIYRGRGIELIVALANRFSDVGFHIVGGSFDQLIRLGIPKSPKNLVCHGFVPPSDVTCYRQKFDVLIAPYQQDVETIGGSKTVEYMSPLKIFEYMSERKLIIASDFPVLREVLNEGNSILVTANRIEEWELAIVRARDRTLVEQLSKAAYNDFLAHYTWDKRVSNVLTGISQ